MLGHDFLISGDDVLSVTQRPLDPLDGRELDAEELDDDVELGVVEELRGVCGEERGIDSLAGLRGVAHKDGRKVEGAAELTGVDVSLLDQDASNFSTDGAGAKQRDVDWPLASQRCPQSRWQGR